MNWPVFISTNTFYKTTAFVKGYQMTVHDRRPLNLIQDLSVRRRITLNKKSPILTYYPVTAHGMKADNL